MGPVNVAYIAIGDELVKGRVRDANGDVLRRVLPFRLEVSLVLCVRDRESEIRSVLRHCLSHGYDWVVVSGGLGPTRDDLTRQAVASELGRSLVWNEETWIKLKQRFQERRSCDPPESNRIQAFFPDGARILPNHVGTAAGFLVQERACQILSLPGVPREFQRLLEENLALFDLPDRGFLPPANQKFEYLLYGVAESEFEGFLNEWDSEKLLSEYTICARAGCLEITFSASEGEMQNSVEIARQLEERYRDFLLARRITSIPQLVIENLREARQSLSLIESCTGGRIAGDLTGVVGSSEVMCGGLVVYQASMKSKLLGVAESLLHGSSVYSISTAAALAQSGLDLFESDLCLAVTGVAGPGESAEGVPEGVFSFAIAGRSSVQERPTIFGIASDPAIFKESAGRVHAFTCRLPVSGDREHNRGLMVSRMLGTLSRFMLLVGVLLFLSSIPLGGFAQVEEEVEDPWREGWDGANSELGHSHFVPRFVMGVAEDVLPTAPPLVGEVQLWSWLLDLSLGYTFDLNDELRLVPYVRGQIMYPTRIGGGLGRPHLRTLLGMGLDFDLLPHEFIGVLGHFFSSGFWTLGLEFSGAEISYARYQLAVFGPDLRLIYQLRGLERGLGSSVPIQFSVRAWGRPFLGRYALEVSQPLDQMDAAFVDDPTRYWKMSGSHKIWGLGLVLQFAYDVKSPNRGENTAPNRPNQGLFGVGVQWERQTFAELLQRGAAGADFQGETMGYFLSWARELQ